MRQIDVAVHGNSCGIALTRGTGEMPHAHGRVDHVTLVRYEGFLRFQRIADFVLHDEPELRRRRVEVTIGRRTGIRLTPAPDDVDHGTVVLHEVVGPDLTGDDIVEIEER